MIQLYTGVKRILSAISAIGVRIGHVRRAVHFTQRIFPGPVIDSGWCPTRPFTGPHRPRVNYPSERVYIMFYSLE